MIDKSHDQKLYEFICEVERIEAEAKAKPLTVSGTRRAVFSPKPLYNPRSPFRASGKQGAGGSSA